MYGVISVSSLGLPILLELAPCSQLFHEFVPEFLFGIPKPWLWKKVQEISCCPKHGLGIP